MRVQQDCLNWFSKKARLGRLKHVFGNIKEGLSINDIATYYAVFDNPSFPFRLRSTLKTAQNLLFASPNSSPPSKETLIMNDPIGGINDKSCETFSRSLDNRNYPNKVVWSLLNHFLKVPRINDRQKDSFGLELHFQTHR